MAKKERFGRSVGKVKEEDIPLFLGDVGKAVSAAGTDYRPRFDSYRGAFLEIAGKYV